MAFNFNWSRAPKIPTQLMGPDVNEEMARQATMQDAAQSMAGYKPSVDINSQMAMQGYAPADNSMKGGNAQPNLEGYGESLQAASYAAAQAQAVEQQKAELQSQIDALQQRIDSNKAKLQNWAGNANQIAAIEARKINSQDPTMIWRWKSQMDENRRLANAQGNGSNDAAKANAAYEIQNDLDSMIVDDTMDSATQKTYLSKLANLKTLAQKNGLKTDSIDAKIKEVKGETNQQKPESDNEEDFDFEGGPRDVGEARATRILQKDPEKLTQNEIMTLKRDIQSGKISVSNETKNKIDKIHSQIIDRDKKRVEDQKKEDAIIKRGKGVTSTEIEWMKGRKNVKLRTDSNGNQWFERVK